MSERMFSEEQEKEALAPSGMYLKVANFEGSGLKLKIAEPVKREKADEGFGDKNGLTNKYIFETQNGELMELTSSAASLARSFIESHCQVGDWCLIKAEKVSKNGKDWVNWSVEKLDIIDSANQFQDKDKNDSMPPF